MTSLIHSRVSARQRGHNSDIKWLSLTYTDFIFLYVCSQNKSMHPLIHDLSRWKMLKKHLNLVHLLPVDHVNKFKISKIPLKIVTFVAVFCYICSSCYICCRPVTFVASRKMSNFVTYVADLLHLLSIVTYVRVVTCVTLTHVDRTTNRRN